jgi:hypothetical protein
MSNRSAAIALLIATWSIPIIWLGAIWAVYTISDGAIGFPLHLISWPFAWTASLMLGAAAAIKWFECADLGRGARGLGTIFSAGSALASFPLGLCAVAAVMSR